MSSFRKWRGAMVGIAVVATAWASGVGVGADADRLDSAATVTEPAVRISRDPIAVEATGTQVGSVGLGQPSREVVPYFEYLMGVPPEVEFQSLESQPTAQGCFGGTDLAVVRWTGVTLILVGDNITPLEDYSFFDFRIDWRAVSDRLLGFETVRGARVGQSADLWQELHPDANSFPGEPDLVGPTLVLADGLHALVDPTTDRVVSVSAVSPVFCE